MPAPAASSSTPISPSGFSPRRRSQVARIASSFRSPLRGPRREAERTPRPSVTHPPATNRARRPSRQPRQGGEKNQRAVDRPGARHYAGGQIGPPGGERMNEIQRHMLRAIAETVVPAVERDDDPHGFWARSGAEVGADEAVA